SAARCDAAEWKRQVEPPASAAADGGTRAPARSHFVRRPSRDNFQQCSTRRYGGASTMRRPLALLGIFGLAAVLPPPAAAQVSPPLSCFATSGTPSIRAEGVAELVGDIVIQCTGGPPTSQGEPLPKQAIEARYSLPVSNSSLTSDLTSALLTIDEPKVSDLA